jgi:hypothetical protein
MKHIKSMVFLAVMVLICMPNAAFSEGGARAKDSKLKMAENIDETERWKLYYEVVGGDEGWELVKDKNGVKVYSRLTPVSPTKSFRGVMNIKADLDELVAFIADPYAYPEYIYSCRAAEVLKYQTNNDYYFRSEVKVMWPIAMRDSITHTYWRKDPETGKVIMDCIGIPELVPEKKGFIRVPLIFMSLNVTPGADGVHELVFEGVIEAGGLIPSWAENLCIWWVPYRSLSYVRKNRPFEHERYKNKKIAFGIDNPYIKNSISEKASVSRAVEEIPMQFIPNLPNSAE